jgi:uncharacterized protein
MPEQMSADERLVITFFEVLSRGDLAALKEYFTSESSWEPMVRGIPGSGAHRGRDAIIDDFLAPIRGLFHDGDPKVHVDRVLGKDGMVFAETHATGRVRAGNKEYYNRYCWAFEIQDDKIRAIREYMDSAYVVRTLFEP